MPASYEKIDYRLRPAKAIERKMLAESFRSLRAFGLLEHYRYIGLGSVYFSDFSLLHRTLAIDSMVSIENTTSLTVQQRFRMNVPFGNIEMRFGHSSAVLQTLTWSQRTIAWMDYDGPLQRSCLEDLDYLVGHVPSGSVVLFSVNAGRLQNAELQEELQREPTPLEILASAVGTAAIPATLQANALSGWGIGKAYREIALSTIERALAARNSALPPGARFHFEPIYFFRYEDGVKMITFGGVVVDEGQRAHLAHCAFDQYPFCTAGEDGYLIDPPLLTYAEMRQIDAERTKPTASLPLPPRDVERYSKFYRFFPKFVEAEVG